MEVAKIDQEEGVEHDQTIDGPIARPAHYIDHMIGASTGALIAILLSRFRESIQDVIDIYVNFADDIFGHPRFGTLTKYGEKNITNVLQRICREKDGEQALLRQPDYKVRERLLTKSQISIVVAQKRNFPRKERRNNSHAQSFESTHLFRSYDHHPSEDPGLGLVLNAAPIHSHDPGPQVWQVARATTAAPTFFREMRIGNDPYMDGGLGANNPAALAWDNARQISRTRDHKLECLISIGTGKFMENSRFDRTPLMGNIPAILRSGVRALSATEPVHEEMERLVGNQSGEKTFYQRFNVDHGQSKRIALDEWKVKRTNTITAQNTDRLRRAFRRHPKPEQDEEQANEHANIPHLMDRDKDGKPALKKDYEYKTVKKIEERTRKYLGGKHRDGREIMEDIRACARRLVDCARARRAADIGRWKYFVGNTREDRSNSGVMLNYGRPP